jgi:bloom syndrome protein
MIDACISQLMWVLSRVGEPGGFCDAEARPTAAWFSDESSESSDISDLEEFFDHDQAETELVLTQISELSHRAGIITTDIRTLMRSNRKDEEIAELSGRRRRIWDEIEELERELCTQRSSGFLSNRVFNGLDMTSDSDEVIETFPEKKVEISPDILEEISRVNQEVFHHMKFRGVQAGAIAAALSGKDVFVLMPTGGGKSLVYQMNGYLKSQRNGGVTVVISPLLSLIEDQCRGLTELGLSNCDSRGETKNDEILVVRRKIERDEMYFLFLTPEKLIINGEVFRMIVDLYGMGKLIAFVVDEAHCISQWGDDFRPEYRQLNILRERFQQTPIIALTATATNEVKKDILEYLDIRNCLVFEMSFNRPNLYYEVIEKKSRSERYSQVSDWIIKNGYREKCGLVFCMAKVEAEEVAHSLERNGINAAFYHAKMSVPDRTQIQQKWVTGDVNCLCCTIAFAMGIDKPNVRYVVHHTMAKSIEAYYQESGRAGRDGLKSSCMLLYAENDVKRIKWLVSHSPETGQKKEDEKVTREFVLLEKMRVYCNDIMKCRRLMILEYFHEEFTEQECRETCDNRVRRKTGLVREQMLDMSVDARFLSRIVSRIYEKRPDCSPYPTSLYVIGVYAGSREKKFVESGDCDFPEFGKGAAAKANKSLLLRVIDELKKR